jgi:hypothetical protein
VNLFHLFEKTWLVEFLDVTEYWELERKRKNVVSKSQVVVVYPYSV